MDIADGRVEERNNVIRCEAVDERHDAVKSGRRQQELADGRALYNTGAHCKDSEHRGVRGSCLPETRNVAGPRAPTKKIYCWTLTALCKQTSEEPGLRAGPVLYAQSASENVGRQIIN